MPPELVQKLSLDPFYEKCCITGKSPVQWHHQHWGKKIQERWAIVPLHKTVHDTITPHKPEYDRKLADYVEWFVLNRATDEELNQKSPRGFLQKRKEELNKQYGKGGGNS